MQHSPCSKLIEDLCVCIMDENNVAMPQDPKSMRNLYIFLREDIRNNLWLQSLCWACKIVYVDMINKLWFLCCSSEGSCCSYGHSKLSLKPCGKTLISFHKISPILLRSQLLCLTTLIQSSYSVSYA